MRRIGNIPPDSLVSSFESTDPLVKDFLPQAYARIVDTYIEDTLKPAFYAHNQIEQLFREEPKPYQVRIGFNQSTRQPIYREEIRIEKVWIGYPETDFSAIAVPPIEAWRNVDLIRNVPPDILAARIEAAFGKNTPEVLEKTRKHLRSTESAEGNLQVRGEEAVKEIESRLAKPIKPETIAQDADIQEKILNIPWPFLQDALAVKPDIAPAVEAVYAECCRLNICSFLDRAVKPAVRDHNRKKGGRPFEFKTAQLPALKFSANGLRSLRYVPPNYIEQECMRVFGDRGYLVSSQILGARLLHFPPRRVVKDRAPLDFRPPAPSGNGKKGEGAKKEKTYHYASIRYFYYKNLPQENWVLIEPVLEEFAMLRTRMALTREVCLSRKPDSAENTAKAQRLDAVLKEIQENAGPLDPIKAMTQPELRKAIYERDEARAVEIIKILRRHLPKLDDTELQAMAQGGRKINGYLRINGDRRRLTEWYGPTDLLLQALVLHHEDRIDPHIKAYLGYAWLPSHKMSWDKKPAEAQPTAMAKPVANAPASIGNDLEQAWDAATGEFSLILKFATATAGLQFLRQAASLEAEIGAFIDQFYIPSMKRSRDYRTLLVTTEKLLEPKPVVAATKGAEQPADAFVEMAQNIAAIRRQAQVTLNGQAGPVLHHLGEIDRLLKTAKTNPEPEATKPKRVLIVDADHLNTQIKLRVETEIDGIESHPYAKLDQLTDDKKRELRDLSHRYLTALVVGREFMLASMGIDLMRRELRLDPDQQALYETVAESFDLERGKIGPKLVEVLGVTQNYVASLGPVMGESWPSMEKKPPIVALAGLVRKAGPKARAFFNAEFFNQPAITEFWMKLLAGGPAAESLRGLALSAARAKTRV